jgi:hypothetical protein
VKVLAVQVWYQVVVVVVTRAVFLFALLLILAVQQAYAVVLPEDRADILYHSYDGGGVEITGPSVLVRKSFGNSVSGFYNYYVDNISSASIDVISQGSPYEERRVENSIGLDYIHDKTTMSASYSSSVENDYDADTYFFSVSQDMFGDLTSVTLSFAKGDNLVSTREGFTRPDFEPTQGEARSYKVTVSQVLTKDMLLGFAYETIADEGFLHSPYRQFRYLDSGSAAGYSWDYERYPNTRTSNAAALRLSYYLPYRASVYGGFRMFQDSWGIDATNWDVGYLHPWGNWLFDLHLRSYTQTGADFYSDLFNSQDEFNFQGRDKEISPFDSLQLGFGVSYEFMKNGWGPLDKGTFNIHYNYMMFDYKDYRNVLEPSTPPGTEPLYSFTANVFRVFASFWF